MKKIAFIFPGLGYSSQKPLLYYTKKLLQKSEYEVHDITYEGVDSLAIANLIKNRAKISADEYNNALAAFTSAALLPALTKINSISIAADSELLFVGKSIGCVIAAAAAKELKNSPDFIFFTPLEAAFAALSSERVLAFSGTADPLVPYQAVMAECHRIGAELHIAKNANHSLETGDLGLDLKSIASCLSFMGTFISPTAKAAARAAQAAASAKTTPKVSDSIYDYKVFTRNHIYRPLSDYKNKFLLIVNTATGCGFTPQYTGLETLYRKYKEFGFEILDFPCNQFANQAPGSSDDIYSFCTSRYSISFDQFAKVDVNGSEEIGLYTYLKAMMPFSGFDTSTLDGKFLQAKLSDEDPHFAEKSDIKWNFTKFLVDRQGHVIRRFEPDVPIDAIEEEIKAGL